MMTKKDFELIAKTIKARADAIRAITGPERDEHSEQVALFALFCVARDLSLNIAVENPKFDRVRFLAACGVNR